MNHECMTVEVWDASDRVLAIVSVPEFFILSEHAPWRALMGDHEMTYCADLVSAAHHRAALIEQKRPRLQDRLYTYTPSKAEVLFSRVHAWVHWKLASVRYTLAFGLRG